MVASAMMLTWDRRPANTAAGRQRCPVRRTRGAGGWVGAGGAVKAGLYGRKRESEGANCRAGHGASLMTVSPGMPAKSAGLWVTRSNPWARAVAAIQASAVEIGRDWRATWISTQQSQTVGVDW